MTFHLAVCVLGLLSTSLPAAPADIPSLAWQERSDWINVRTDVKPAAVGDGRADDTAAIQAALDLGRQSKAVHLPPGTYRITKTLVFQGPAVGCLVIGHGRDTRLVWDGAQGGRMFWSNGVAYSRYVGLSWDGRGKAAVGFDHAAQERFETEVGSEHGSSIRRCTSVGSRRFVEETGTIAPLTIQDCHVAGWTDPEGAVHLNGSPVLMFDCSFTRSPSDRPSVKLANPGQALLISNNRPGTTETLVQTTPAAKVYSIPPGQRGGVIVSAEQRFLSDSASVPGRIFDAVTTFGAKGDGTRDDTAAIQAAIDAARQAGRGAMAYLPTGRYLVSKTLSLTGRDYTFGGSGFRCGLVWRGEAGRPLIEVAGVQHVTPANLAVGNHDFGPMNHGDDIRRGLVALGVFESIG